MCIRRFSGSMILNTSRGERPKLELRATQKQRMPEAGASSHTEAEDARSWSLGHTLTIVCVVRSSGFERNKKRREALLRGAVVTFDS
jgi:hypothetical protein